MDHRAEIKKRKAESQRLTQVAEKRQAKLTTRYLPAVSKIMKYLKPYGLLVRSPKKPEPLHWTRIPIFDSSNRGRLILLLKMDQPSIRYKIEQYDHHDWKPSKAYKELSEQELFSQLDEAIVELGEDPSIRERKRMILIAAAIAAILALSALFS